MKKLLYTLSALAAVFIVAGCARELRDSSVQEESTELTFTVAVPDVVTKAIGDGTGATELTFAVYDEAGNYLQDLSESAATISGANPTWTVSVPVVKDLTYQFAFVAKAATGPYAVDRAAKTVTATYGNANDDAADLFVAAKTITITDALNETIKLVRPLAQVNVGASDLVAAAYSLDVENMTTGLKLTGINNVLNILDGTVSGAAEITLAEAARVNEGTTQFVTGYDRIVMGYVLVGEKQTSDATINITAKGKADGADKVITREVANIPLQANYRTNILGNIFTSSMNFTVTVEPEFDTPEYNEQAGMTIAKANTAFENGQTSVTIDTDPATAGDGVTTITLPATSDAVRIRLNITTSETITIEYAASGEKPASLELYAQNVAGVTANLQSTTVTVSAGSKITTGTFATAPTTLIIEDTAEVTNLMIKAGNVKLGTTAKVTSINRTEDNADTETVVEVEAGLSKYPTIGTNVRFNKTITGVTIEKTETEATYTVTSEAKAESALKAIIEDNNSEPKETVNINLKGSEIEWTTGSSIGSTPIIPTTNTTTQEIVIDGGGTGVFTATGAGVGDIRATGDGALVFKNTVIVDHSVSYAEGSWEYGYLEFSGKVRFENCTIKSAITLESEEDTSEDVFEFVDCTFESDTEASDWVPTPSNMYSVWISSGTSSFTNCDFSGYRGAKIHEAYGSEVTEVSFDGCTFHDISKKPGIALGTLNAATKVSITNCTFTNCQAGDQGLYAYETDTPVANFDFVFENNNVQLAAGINQTGNIYNVTDAAANTAIAFVYSNAKSQGFTEFTINLPAGEFTLSSPAHSNATIHIAGVGADTKLSLGSREVSYPGATIDFSNLTMIGDTDTDFTKEHGLTHLAKETYTNVTFTKFRFFYAPECTLNNCKFVQDAYDYAFCSYGITTMVLNDCEIECVGKAAKIYGVTPSNPSTVTFNRCKFNADGSARQSAGKDWKAVAEIDARLGNNTPFTVNFNETVSCTGFYTSENTAIEKTDANYQGTLYNVDNGSGSKIVVNIDGVQQTQAW